MEWSWLINPFLVIARRSRILAEKVADYTYAALDARNADPFFGPLFTAFKLVYDPMKAEQTSWQAQKGVQKGSTKSVDDLLADVVKKINKWDREISIVFEPGSPDYLKLLPNGHAPFGTNKKKDDRIKALKALSENLDGIVPLAATKTDVDNFIALLDPARNTQKGQISNTKDDSEELTDAMEDCMVGLWIVLCSCLVKFAATPEDVKPIFDISTIRDMAQTLFIDTVKKGNGTMDNIFKRTLSQGRFLKVTVLSNKPLAFFMADEKNDPATGKVVTVQGEEEEIIDVTKLQASSKSSFFKVLNTDDNVDGHFKVEILAEGNHGVAN